MKKTYEKPMVEMSMVDQQDVITTSQIEMVDNFLDFNRLRSIG